MKLVVKLSLFFFIIFLGIFLRVYCLGNYGIWYDEKISVCCANGLIYSDYIDATFTNLDIQKQNSIKNVINATIADKGNSLFYNILLHYWSIIFNNSDFSVRLLSAFFGCCLILLTYKFTKFLFNSDEISLMTAFLVAIQPLFVHFAHEARAYTTATFFTLLSSYLLYKILEDDKVNIKIQYVFYILSATISLLSHYLTIYIFLAHAVIVLLIAKSKKYWLSYFAASICVCFLFGLWLFNGGVEGYKKLNSQNIQFKVLAEQFKKNDNPFFMPATFKNVITGWFQIWLPVFGNQLQTLGFRIREISILLIIPFSVIGATIWLNRKKEIYKKMSFLLILIIMQTIFATFLAIRSKHCISFQPLYANFVIPYSTILIGYSLFYLMIQKKNLKIFGYIAFILIVLIMLISQYSIFTDTISSRGTRIFNPYQKIGNIINTEYKAGDYVLFGLAQDAYLTNLFLQENIKIDQKFNISFKDRVLLYRNSNSDTLELFDFNNGKYRY
jgi:uncharacterized membrane protein